MSNTWLNVRLGTYHLQCLMLSEWGPTIRRGRCPVTFRSNPYQESRRVNEPDHWRWFELLELRWPW